MVVNKERGRPHKHTSEYKKSTDGNEPNRTKENMQGQKQARKRKGTVGGARLVVVSCKWNILQFDEVKGGETMEFKKIRKEGIISETQSGHTL